MECIVIDREKFKDFHRIFNRPKRFSSKHDLGLVEGGGADRFWVFRAPGSRDLEFWFDMAGLAALKGESPTLGRRGFEVLLGMIYFAKRGQSLRGQFRASEMAKFLRKDPPESGRFYDDIRRTFYSIVTVEVCSRRFGHDEKDSREQGFRFITKWEHDATSKEYLYALNPQALGITSLWLEGKLNEENMHHGYIRYPLSYVKERLEETEKAFRDYLLLTRKTITVRAWTIARDWCGFSEDVLKRRRLVHDRLFGYLGNAEERGDIESWRSMGLKLNTWKTEWKITITKPRKSIRKGGRQKRAPSLEEQELIAAIYNWQRRPIHGLEWGDEELHERIKNTVRAYGVEAIGKLYAEHGLGAYPNVYRFWQGVKELKVSRESQAVEAEVDHAAV